MGKGNRNRETRLDNTADNGAQKLSKLQLIKQQEKKEKTKKIVSIVCVVVFIAAIVVGVLAATGVFNKKLGKIAAGRSDKFEITDDMVAYYMYNEYRTLLTNYSSYASYIGLDTSKSLTAQNPSAYGSWFGYSSEITWFENFANNAKSNLSELIALASKAKDEGLVLDADDEKEIDDVVKDIKAAAKENGYSANEYLSLYYTQGVTVDTIRKCYDLQALATKYYEKLTDGDDYKFTAEDEDKYAEDNKSMFYTYDYICYEFEPELADGETEPTDEAKAAAKAKAEELLAAADVESFKKAVNEIEKKANATGKAAESDVPALTEDEKDYSADFIEEGAAYMTEGELAEWINAAERKEGDTKLICDDDGCCLVYCLIKPAHKDETKLRSVRHILIQNDADTDEAKAAAKAEAEKILAEYKAGELTADAFGALANKYSEDPGSNTVGGLYEDVAPGDMVEEFNDWLFDESRAEGDTGVVETSYGAHVMFFVGETKETWRVGANNSLKNEKYEEDVTALIKQYPVTFDNEAILRIAEY